MVCNSMRLSIYRSVLLLGLYKIILCLYGLAKTPHRKVKRLKCIRQLESGVHVLLYIYLQYATVHHMQPCATAVCQWNFQTKTQNVSLSLRATTNVTLRCSDVCMILVPSRVLASFLTYLIGISYRRRGAGWNASYVVVLLCNLQSQRRNDRDAIRRRLATGFDGEYCYCVCSETGDRQRRRRRCSSSSSSSGFAVDLEVCLVGDSPSASDDDRATWPSSTPSDTDSQTVWLHLNIITAVHGCRFAGRRHRPWHL